MNYNVVTFSYHDVCDDPNESGFIRKSALPYKLTTAKFIRNIEEIKSSQIKPIKIGEIKDKSSKHKILLTFDDGGKSAMHIADILEKYNWFGHFFVTTSMIGNFSFLNKSEINDLFKRGHILGTHSHTHPTPFRKLSHDEMLREWSTSIDILNQILGSKIICGSVPGGDMDDKTIRSASECGIQYLFTSEPSNKTWSENTIMLLGRVCPKINTELSKIKNFACNKGFLKEKILRKIKNSAKFLLGPIYSQFIKIYHN